MNYFVHENHVRGIHVHCEKLERLSCEHDLQSVRKFARDNFVGTGIDKLMKIIIAIILVSRVANCT